MAKFARDCIHKVNKLSESLSKTLGEDTLALGLRVGLHSGEVTAGVLRGDKSRVSLMLHCQLRMAILSSTLSL